MAFFTWMGVLIILYYLIYMIVLAIVDCDVMLALAELFGKKLDKLQGKIVWITGASSGIGEAMAYEVARNNGKLVLSARRQEELERVKARCMQLNASLTPRDIMVLPMDVRKLDTHKACFDLVLQHFGSLDILINNAGRSQRAIWENIDIQVDHEMFGLNVFGVVSLSRIVVQYFASRGKGHIVVTSSLAGKIGAPFSSSYTASKHAIHGYFESLRNEKLGTKLQITLLCPGPVFSNFLSESFTENVGEKYGRAVGESDRRMTSERCAKLAMIAVVNKLDEAWMAPKPIIPLIYAMTYFPNVAKRITKALGPRMFQRLRDSRGEALVSKGAKSNAVEDI